MKETRNFAIKQNEFQDRNKQPPYSGLFQETK